MDVVLWIASWVVAVGAVVGFVGLGVYALTVRRAALLRRSDSPGPRRAEAAQMAGGIAGLAVILALATQVLLVPFYARSFLGRTVRANFVSVTSEADGKSKTLILHAVYKDASGQKQPVEDWISGWTYERRAEMFVACDRPVPQADADKQCVDFVVVDDVPGVAQYGSRPIAPLHVLFVPGVLAGILLFGLRRSARSLRVAT
jgi:hypothetical protein